MDLSRRHAVLGAVALPLLSQASAGSGQGQPVSHRHLTADSARKEQEAFAFLALRMFVEVDSDDTGGSVAVVRVFVPPGAGAAPHVHSREDEVFTVVRGHYRFRHGDEEVDAPAGSTLFMRRGIPHTFRNVADEPGEHLVTLVPGGLEKMFREISAGQFQMPRDRARYDAVLARYGMQSLPPDSLPFTLPGS